MKTRSIIISLFLIGILIFNISLLSNINNSFDISSLNPKIPSAWAVGEGGSGNSTRDCLKAQKLRVTSISGCVNISVSVGDLLDSSAGLDACVSFDWKDCYKIDCYDGYDNCTPYNWQVCSTSGCPSFCQ